MLKMAIQNNHRYAQNNGGEGSVEEYVKRKEKVMKQNGNKSKINKFAKYLSSNNGPYTNHSTITDISENRVPHLPSSVKDADALLDAIES